MATLVLTGVTGLLGRCVLYELLRAPEADLRLVALGRAGGHESFQARLRALMASDGAVYLGLSPQEAVARLDTHLVAHEATLDQPGLGLSASALAALRALDVHTAFHGAAATTFKKTAKAKALVEKANVIGTQHVLALLDTLAPRRLVYVGSAYSAGRIEGEVCPDELDLAGTFPNPYQESKAIAEGACLDWGRRTDTPTVIVRPATIGGRLLEQPIGHVPKYDVFLGWAKAMLLMKAYFAGGVAAALTTRIQWDMRLYVHHGSGLNIVPADWCGKQVAWLLTHEGQHGAYHLANPVLTSHPMYVSQMVEALMVDGLVLQDTPVEDPTAAEQFYFDRLGHIYASYVETAPLIFDREAQGELEAATGVACPRVDDEAFAILLKYATDRDFGLEDRSALA